MTNPSELQPEASSPHDSARAAEPSSARYFTQITFHGCNLLGLVNLFTFIGLFEVTVSTVSPASRTLGLIVLALAAGACSAADIAIRILTNTGGRHKRLFSPHAGGALLYIPLWTVYPAMAIGIAAVNVFRR